MKKMRMKVLALCFSMTLTVSALAGNGRFDHTGCHLTGKQWYKRNHRKDSTTSADTAEIKSDHRNCR